MDKYNIEELAEKLERCKNVNFDDVKLEDVDELTSIKIVEENLATKEY